MPHQFDASVAKISHAGVDAAQRLGYALVVEHSDRSEAVYLHVRRVETWFGFRIACHRPVHECSRDYEQFLVTTGSDAQQRELIDRIVAAVASGGLAVADPVEVRQHIQQAEMRRADGVTIRDAQGHWWTWNGTDLAWSSPDGTTEGKPEITPMVRVSSHVACAIRHRLNHMARWSYEEFCEPS